MYINKKTILVSLILMMFLLGVSAQAKTDNHHNAIYELKDKYIEALDTIGISDFNITQENTGEEVKVCIYKAEAINKCQYFKTYTEETSPDGLCVDGSCYLPHELSREQLEDNGLITKTYYTPDKLQKKVDKWIEKTLTIIAKATIKRG